MNIKDFLIDNYIYIIIVIVLIIITIIGFLADKKTKGRSTGKDVLPNNNANLGNAAGSPAMQQPMNYQPAVPTNETMNVGANGPLVNNNVPVEPVNFGQVNNGLVNSINPVMPQETSTNNNSLNVVPGMIQGAIVTPNPVPPVEVAQPTIVPPQNVAPIPAAPGPIYQMPQGQPAMNTPVEPTPMASFNQPMPSNNMPGVLPNNINMVPNSEPTNLVGNFGSVNPVTPVNPAPIPTPVEPVQPVNPIPPVPNIPVNPVPVSNPVIPNQGTMPQPVNNSQLNFVYGNQQSNQNNNNTGYMQ